MTKPLALAALLCLACSAGAADLAVKPVASTKKPAAGAGGGAAPERVLRPLSAEPQYWLSAAAGVLTTDDGEMSSQGFGGYVSNGRALGGVRARFNRGFNFVRHGRELGLMIGQPLSNRVWYAMGISRYEYERRDPNNPERREVIGMPIELVAAPGWSNFGIELRAEANINSAHPQLMLGIGARFGRLR